MSSLPRSGFNLTPSLVKALGSVQTSGRHHPKKPRHSPEERNPPNRDVHEIFVLLGCYAVSSGNSLPTFR